jgi:HEAT repeat protein
MNMIRAVCIAAFAVGGVCEMMATVRADEPYTIKHADIKPVAGGYSLQFTEKKASIEELLSELKVDNLDTRKDAIRAIQWPEHWPAKDRKALIEALGDRLKDSDAGIRFTAAESLDYVGTDAVAVLPALMEATKDENDLIRSRAIGAISKIGPKAKPAIPVLITRLGDKQKLIAGFAADALGNIGSEAVPSVEKELNSKNAQVRKLAADALAMIGPDAKDAVAALKELLNDDDKKVARAAQLAIDDIEEKPGRTIRIFPRSLKHSADKER